MKIATKRRNAKRLHRTGAIISVNAAFCEITGYAAPEVIVPARPLAPQQAMQAYSR